MTNPHLDSHPLSDFLSHVRLAPRQAHKSLTLWPLVLTDEGAPAAGPEYVALGTALVRKLEERPARGPHFETPEAFLSALAGAPFTSGPSLGAGDDLRIGGPEVAGCALAHEGLVHVTAFPAQG
jgi:hypothetical protein